jgi:serine/threonine protein kinase
MPLPRETRLGPYSIVSLIGSGGMGEVYRAWDARLERDVAVKVLAQGLSMDERALSRFRKGARAIAASAHPNILAIYDAELDHPPLFLVTELLEGEALRSTIERSRLPWRRAVEIGASVADGLATALCAVALKSLPNHRKASECQQLYLVTSMTLHSSTALRVCHWLNSWAACCS